MATRFVPVTDEVWRLQNGTGPECKLFQQMAREGHDNGKYRTKQGTYVCTPRGTLLASGNSNNPQRILAIMEEGWRAWQQTSPAARRLPVSAFLPQHRWEDSYPEDGLVLWMFTRDLSASEDPEAPRSQQWNQDAIWFSAAEARAWLPTRLTSDERHVVPSALSHRLARLHFVDTVKGQTSPFRRNEVEGTEITTRIRKREGTVVQIAIDGRTHAASTKDGPRQLPHGIDTQLSGTASFDEATGRFVAFEVVALGQRWGHTRFNDRREDLPESGVGFVVRLAAPDAPKVAPGLIASYGVPWVRRPPRP